MWQNKGFKLSWPVWAYHDNVYFHFFTKICILVEFIGHRRTSKNFVNQWMIITLYIIWDALLLVNAPNIRVRNVFALECVDWFLLFFSLQWLVIKEKVTFLWKTWTTNLKIERLDSLKLIQKIIEMRLALGNVDLLDSKIIKNDKLISSNQFFFLPR